MCRAQPIPPTTVRMMTSQKIDDGARRLSRGGEDGGGALGGGGDGGGGGGDGGGDGGGGGDGILEVRTLDRISLALESSHFGRPWAIPAGEHAWVHNHQLPAQGAGRVRWLESAACTVFASAIEPS